MEWRTPRFSRLLVGLVKKPSAALSHRAVARNASGERHAMLQEANQPFSGAASSNEDPAFTNFFEGMHHGVLVVDRNLRIVFMNSTIAEMLGANGMIYRSNCGRLRMESATELRKLARLVSEVIADSGDMHLMGSRKMLVTNAVSEHPYALTVSPWGGNGNGSGAHAIIFIFDPNFSDDFLAKNLAEFFDLTPAETCLAACLLNGALPKEAAQRLGLSINTVKTQARAIYSKTKTRNQVELFSLAYKLT